MHISSFEIQNYKSIYKLPEITLSRGFNILVGENNVGKSALMEGLSTRFARQSHISSATLPRENGVLQEVVSKVTIKFWISHLDLEDIIVNFLPNFRLKIPSTMEPEVAIATFWKLAAHGVTLVAMFVDDGSIAAYFLEWNDGNYQVFTMQPGDQRPRHAGTGGDELPLAIARLLRTWVFHFVAERSVADNYSAGFNKDLMPNAENLAQTLNTIQSERNYGDYLSLVKQVLPQIHHVSVKHVSDSAVQIRISPEDAPKMGHLTFGLKQTGTGISQILALLYVIHTSSQPRVMLVDEPQNYLHPRALQRLIEILKSHPEHQYVFTTHSPLLITATDPGTLMLVSKPETHTQVELLDKTNTEHLRRVLDVLGSRMSDVFGADRLLWVEGATEEKCFPLILKRLSDFNLTGTSIMRVANTGDFKRKRDRKRIIEIYKTLSRGSFLLQAARGFLFDREELSELECDEIRQSTHNEVDFLPRRMIENYFLNPKAIAAVLTKNGVDTTVEQIDRWLDEKYPDRNLSADWHKTVDASYLLNRLFIDFSASAPLIYDGNKPHYGEALTSWLIENDPDDLKELAALIVGKLK